MFPDPKDQMVVTLVDQCLRLGPRNRISAKEALNHAFFAQTEIQARETKTNSEPTVRPSGESSTKPAPVVEPPKTKDVPQASVGTSKVISRPGSMAVNPKRTVGGVRNGVPQQRAVSPRVRTRAASPALGRIVRPNEARTAKQGSSLSARSVSPRQPVRALSSSNLVSRRSASPRATTAAAAAGGENAKIPSTYSRLVGATGAPASASYVKRPPSPRRSRGPVADAPTRTVTTATATTKAMTVGTGTSGASAMGAPRLIRRPSAGFAPKTRVESPRRQRGVTESTASTEGQAVVARHESPRTRLYRPATSSSSVVGATPGSSLSARSVSPRQPVRALSSSNLVSRRSVREQAQDGAKEEPRRVPPSRTKSDAILGKRSVTSQQDRAGTRATSAGPARNTEQRGREALLDLPTNGGVESTRGRQSSAMLANRRPRSVSPRLSRMAQHDPIVRNAPVSSTSSSLLAPHSSPPIKSIGRQLLDEVDMKKKNAGKEMEMLRNAVDEYLGKHHQAPGVDIAPPAVRAESAAPAGSKMPPPAPPRQTLTKIGNGSRVLTRRAASVDAITRRRLGRVLFFYREVERKYLRRHCKKKRIMHCPLSV